MRVVEGKIIVNAYLWGRFAPIGAPITIINTEQVAIW